MIQNFWDSLHFVGCPMFILASKLRTLKAMLKVWNVSSFGDINSRVASSKSALDLVQLEISDHGPSDERFRHEDAAQARYQTDLSLHDIFLREKARIRWLVDGDRNTSFLHNMVKIR